jgi:glycosyltransferase involved in cell wall biosynthesis
MIFGLDLRGLNYKPRTGVNTYTLHLLFQLYKLKQTQKTIQNQPLKFVAVGLRPERWLELKKEFRFLEDLLDEQIPLVEFLGWPDFLNYPKLLNVWLAIKAYFGLSLTLQRPRQSKPNHLFPFDWLICPQPKPLSFNLNTKMLLVVHDIYAPLDNRGLLLFESLRENKRVYQNILNSATKIWASSYSTAHDLVQNFQILDTKIKLVYPALPIWDELVNNQGCSDLDRTSTAVSLKATAGSTRSIDSVAQLHNSTYILALSGIEPRKNWHNLLRAFQILQRQNPDIKLVLAGTVVNPNYFQNLQLMIQDLCLRNVIWVLNPDEPSKADLIKNCLFVAYPSLYEGFGFPILEAFKFGKSVLCGKVSSMPELAQQAGLFCNPLDIQDLAAGLSVLVQDTAFRQKLEQHTKSILSRFSWDEVGSACATLLDH